MSGYKIRDQYSVHFMTFTVVGWIDLFTRKAYKDLIIDSLKFCQKEKGLVVHAYVIMESHMHIVASAREGSDGLSAIIRDFKKHTSKTIVKQIKGRKGESRRDWLLFTLETYGKKLKKVKKYQLWQHSNHAMLCLYPKFTMQKVNYIHKNPVKSEIVSRPEDYVYSSARNYIFCGLPKSEDQGFKLDVEVLYVRNVDAELQTPQNL